MSDLVRLLVSCHHADGLDEGVPRVVHARLNGLIQRVTIWSGPITQLGIDGRRQATGHAVVVFAQVWVLRTEQIQIQDSNISALIFDREKLLFAVWAQVNHGAVPLEQVE